MAPLKGASGRATHLIAVQRDITEHVKMQEALDDALIAGQEADRAKLDFLAVMNHELRTQLNAIIGFSEILSRYFAGRGEDSDEAEYVRLVKESGERLLQMVNDILEFAREPGRKEGPVFTPVDVGATVRHCVNAAESFAESRSVHIAAAELHGLSTCAFEPSLRRMFSLILDNAIKFSPRGGRVVIAGAAYGDAIHVTISDEGLGIAPEHRDKLFVPFAQANSSLNRPHEGLGLGLAITQRLAHSHGGRIEIESEPDRGTRAHVILRAQPCAVGCTAQAV